MALKNLIAYPLLFLLLTGCAGLSEKERQEMNGKLSSMRTALDETNAKLEELDNKFILLHEKAEAQKAEIERIGSIPSAPPEGLKVVSLGEDGETKGAEPGRDKKIKTEAQRPQQGRKGAAESAEAIYNRGQDLFMAGKYPEARAAFNSLVKAYPNHNLADNALYWVGESYYSEKDYEKAVERFRDVVDRYPGENKAPDALLKVAFSQLEINNRDMASATLLLLIKRYPDTEAAVKARTVLDKVFANPEKRKD